MLKMLKERTTSPDGISLLNFSKIDKVVEKAIQYKVIKINLNGEIAIGNVENQLQKYNKLYTQIYNIL